MHRTIQKNGLNDQENHHGVVSHLELVILECEIKWALGSITKELSIIKEALHEKASGSDGIPVELFQILKDEVV